LEGLVSMNRKLANVLKDKKLVNDLSENIVKLRETSLDLLKLGVTPKAGICILEALEEIRNQILEIEGNRDFTQTLKDLLDELEGKYDKT